MWTNEVVFICTDDPKETKYDKNVAKNVSLLNKPGADPSLEAVLWLC
jgi:hypothetical protein